MMLSAYYYGQIDTKVVLNEWGVRLEILLFLSIQILYGYTEGLLNSNKDKKIQDLQEKSIQHRKREENQSQLDVEKIEQSSTLKAIMQKRKEAENEK